MNTRQSSPVSGRRLLRGRVLAGVVTFLATVAAAPGYAVNIPNVPLQSQAEYPPANVRFILDDSGSMNSVGMPADLQDPAYPVSNFTNINYSRITHASYVHNTIYYNPATTYQPWMKADGTRHANADYTAAARNTTLRDSDFIDLRDEPQTFYVPRNPPTTSTNAADYYRYQIISGTSVVRTEFNGDFTPSPFPLTGRNDTNSAVAHVTAVEVPAGLAQVTFQSSGGTHGTNGGVNNNNGDGADLYVRFNNSNVGNNPDCRSERSANDETCVIQNPQAGTWYVGLVERSAYRNVTMTVTYSGWVNETAATPTGRTVPAEVQNYANWYTYHRTRMKVAKAGASEALSRVGEKLRIGLDTINRNTTGIPYDIPVGNDDGLFRGSNKSTWYDRLQLAQATNSTPLHRALQRAGNYFSRTDAAGPWGPQAIDQQISCRQNFAILTTDGFWNSTTSYSSIGDADGTAGTKVIGSTGLKEFTYAPKNPYQDNFNETSTKTRGDTLADVAMHYWKNDLRPDTDPRPDVDNGLENNVPASMEDRPDTDPAFWQHMVTFGVSIGLKGRLNPASDLDSISNGTLHWPDPVAGGEDEDRIDDLWHASVNGRGSFLVASNTKEFTDGLLDAFAAVAERLGSASNVTANSTSFISNTRVYQASYMSGRWSGELAAYDASESGVADFPRWKASALIPGSGRNILTWNGSSGVTFPTSAQTAMLDQGSRPIAPVSGVDNAAYIKGARSLEKQNDGELRNRDSVLGDIVNSSPMYVKDTETIFVGANDGMLHAFDALTGVERFAYVPSGINFSKLATLSSPQYSHEYFVDGPVIVSNRASTSGRNYLVGTLGRGGKGVYALDVTNPSAFGTGDIKWELNSGGNLGYVVGEPLIATLNDGTKVVLFGNGVNSDNRHAVLYVVNLLTGMVMQEIDTGIGGDNGLSSPRGWDEDGNGTLDYVYAGDLYGNVWKFDFSSSGTGSIAFGGLPLFAAGTGQPITADIALARDPATGKRWVFAGTGRLLSTGDLSNTTIQSMYGLVDDASGAITKAQLQQRTIAVVDATGKRGFEPPGTLPSGKRGWYLDLSKPTPGERVINRPLVDGSALFFATVIPPTSNSCDAGGKGYLNALDAFSGTSLRNPFFDANGDGKFNDDDKLTSDSGDVVAVGSMDPGIGMLTKPIIIRGPRRSIAVVGGSLGGKADPPVNPPGTAPQRVSWREILRD